MQAVGSCLILSKPLVALDCCSLNGLHWSFEYLYNVVTDVVEVRDDR